MEPSSSPIAAFAAVRVAAVAFAVVACATLAACSSTPPPKAPIAPVAVHQLRAATANITPASGTLVSGRLNIEAVDGGVHIRGELGGLGRGTQHAIHIHERGDCSAADGSSAGGHFNPAGAAHGRAGHGAHHAGDMDNLQADAGGVARIDIQLRGVVLGGGVPVDILGRAIIVHAAPDDYSSQPSGNAGARIGCGVIEAKR